MKELIKIGMRPVGLEATQTCNARDIWLFVESKQHFSDWIKGRIDKYGFTQDVDFTVHKIMNEYNQAVTIDYFLTVDMGKELAMVENNDKGREVRRYFIECEKRVKQQQVMTIRDEAENALKCWLNAGELLGCPKHLSQIEAVKAVRRDTGVDFSPQLALAPAQNNIKKEERFLEPTELARELDYKSARAVNAALEEAGLQVKTIRGWETTEEGAAVSVIHSWVKGSKSGYNLKWDAEKVSELIV